MKRVVVAAAALVLIAGCSSGAPANAPASQASPAAGSSAPAETTPAAETSMTKEFGSTFKWDDGVEFTLTAPAEFTPGPYVKDMIQNKAFDEFVIMDATLVNGTDEPLSPMMVNVQATSGDDQAEAVFDTSNGVDLPTADILPGKTSKFKVAFARTKGADFVAQVSNLHDMLAEKGYYQ